MPRGLPPDPVVSMERREELLRDRELGDRDRLRPDGDRASVPVAVVDRAGDRERDRDRDRERAPDPSESRDMERAARLRPLADSRLPLELPALASELRTLPSRATGDRLRLRELYRLLLLRLLRRSVVRPRCGTGACLLRMLMRDRDVVGTGTVPLPAEAVDMDDSLRALPRLGVCCGLPSTPRSPPPLHWPYTADAVTASSRAFMLTWLSGDTMPLRLRMVAVSQSVVRVCARGGYSGQPVGAA